LYIGSTDWRSIVESLQPAKRSMLEKEFQEYYQELVRSIADTTLESPDGPTELQLSNSKEEALNQEVNINKELKNYLRRGWEYYGRFGLALAQSKYLYFDTCFQCKPLNPDIFTVLSCNKCVKASNGNKFFEDLKLKGVTYSNSYINSLIQIARLGRTFPNVKRTPWNFEKLNKYMSYLPDQMKQDKDIWRFQCA